MTIRTLPSLWARGEAGHAGGSKMNQRFSGGSFWTDGSDLWSYSLRIGFTDRITGKKVLLDFTASTGNFTSQTTSKHVGAARMSADVIVSPDDPEVDVENETLHFRGQMINA
jgi:hypothetical protein